MDRAELADPAEVVAEQVDDHEVLGAVLRVGPQVLGEPQVLGRLAPRGRVPLIGLDSARRRVDERKRSGEELRPDLAEAQEGRERRRVDPAQRAVEAQRVGATSAASWLVRQIS